MNKNVLAFDLGASSGRAILGRYQQDTFEMQEIHRFENNPIECSGVLYWDLEVLLQEIKRGIQLALEKAGTVHSLAIDTWGVDYGLLDENGNLIDHPTHYRDSKTSGMFKVVSQIVSKEEIYQKTGIQQMEINTLYQLKADFIKRSDKMKQAKTLLMMPNLIGYLLTGAISAERSIASTTGLLNPKNQTWHSQLINDLGLPIELFPPISKEGSFLGTIKEELDLPAIPVYQVCSHDTASAFASSAGDERSLFVSCGTWSLIGAEILTPIINKEAEYYNFTNEIGIDGTIRFLKNITGLWIIQELKREFNHSGKDYSYTDFEELLKEAEPFQSFIDVAEPVFEKSGRMSSRIKAYLKKTNQEVPQTDGQLIRIVYESLVLKYKETFTQIEKITGSKFLSIHMVGGGTQSSFLCQAVADASGPPVLVGSSEATALGNLGVQLKALGCFQTTSEMRQWIRRTVQGKKYAPIEEISWGTCQEKFTYLLFRS